MRSLLQIITIATVVALSSARTGSAQQPQAVASLEQQLSQADSLLTSLHRRFQDESPQVQIASLQRQLIFERLRHKLEVALVRAEADQHALEYRFTNGSPQVRTAIARVDAARRAFCDLASDSTECSAD